MRRILQPLILLAAASCSSSPAAPTEALDGGPHQVEVGDAGVPDAAIPDPDAAPPDAAVPTAPIVEHLTFPSQPTGTFALTVLLRDDTSPSVDLTLELSCDELATWRPLTIEEPLLGLPAGLELALHWDSLADVAFHTPQTCAVRATPTDLDGLVGAALVVETPVLDNLREAARRVDLYLAHYGALTPSVIAIAKLHQMVILDPGAANLTQARVTDLQRGVDPADPADDVIVLCYVSVGEDRRTTSKTDAQLLADPRFVGDGTGPRVDPRGPGASGGSLWGIDPAGTPSAAGTGFASYYLDDNDVYRNGLGDGRPDRNANFGGAFVNAGDPAWYETLAQMSLDGPDHLAGLDEILTDFSGRGLGCDGLFLDTIDTAAPNSYTNAGSDNLSQFEWTGPGFRDFLEHLRDDHPGKLILQNRGLFFFDPRHRQFAFTTGASIDYSMFESFRLDSSSAYEFEPFHFNNNRYNLAPALLAEANRAGFRALSLGYAEGPSDTMNELTLIGQSTLGFDSLVEDLEVAHQTGFRHYLTSASLTRTNTFVLDHCTFDDDSPPTWTSTYNDHNTGYPNPPGAPSPRIGVQQIVPGPFRLTVRWDVALDTHRVAYAAYYQAWPFDFAADPDLLQATRVVLSPGTPSDYQLHSGAGRYAHETDLSGLLPGLTYFVIIRAFDDSPTHNEDTNQHVLAGTPLP